MLVEGVGPNGDLIRTHEKSLELIRPPNVPELNQSSIEFVTTHYNLPNSIKRSRMLLKKETLAKTDWNSSELTKTDEISPELV